MCPTAMEARLESELERRGGREQRAWSTNKIIHYKVPTSEGPGRLRGGMPSEQG